MYFRAQGAIESSSRTTAGTLVGQGATEYLVLLAVVLIVALVSVALLGFFPGMASDAQITQSQAYWKGASPISIYEFDATTDSNYGLPYLRIRNSGAYPIRITKVLGNGQSISGVAVTNDSNILSDYFYMAPGEEKYFGWTSAWNLPANRLLYIYIGSSGSSKCYLYGASSVCSTDRANPGVLNVKDFGFEYIEYIEGQQITKKQIGKPLIIKCRPYP